MKVPKCIAPLVDLFKKTFERWSEHDVYRLGAAFSYYAMFSVFPFLLLVVAAIGYVVGEGDVAREQVLAQFAHQGSSVWDVLDRTLRSMQGHTATRGLAAFVAIVGMAFGAAGAFGELYHTLNQIWSVPKREHEGLVATILVTIREQLISLAVVVVLGLTLVLSLALTTSIAFLTEHASELPILSLHHHDLVEPIARVGEIAVSFGLLTAIFIVAYHFVPRSRPPVRGLIGGAALTAALLIVLKELAAQYLMKLGGFSAYGVVGGLLALQTWIFFSSQAIFMAAQLTQVLSERASASSSSGRHTTTAPRKDDDAQCTERLAVEHHP